MQKTPERESQITKAHRRLRWLAARAALAIGLIALGMLTAQVAKPYPVSSDDATGVLEAATVLRGNVLLSGWTVSNISFLATDLPYYVAGVALKGVSPALLREVPSAVYAVAVLVSVALAASRSRSVVLATITVVVLLGLPGGGLAEFGTKGYTRVGTSIFLFGALLALARPPGRAVSLVRLLIYTIIVVLAFSSDTYFLLLCVIPVLVVLALAAIRGETYGNLGRWRVAAATILAFSLSGSVITLIHSLGGFTIRPLPVGNYLSLDRPLQTLFSNASAIATYLPSLYRADLPPAGAWPRWGIWLLCLIGPALMVYAAWWARPWRRPRGEGDFASDVLLTSMALGLAAFLASTNEKDRGTIRYMIPFMLSGAVLTGRMAGNRIGKSTPILALLAVLAAAYGVTIGWDLFKPPANDQAIALANSLEKAGLRFGYGPYWDASIVTVSSRGRVAVRPIRSRMIDAHRPLEVEPFRWMSDETWYLDEPANFVVYKKDPGSKYHFGIQEANCIAWFGQPVAKHTMGPYQVLVWNKDLRSFLTQNLPWTP
jgi:hypothetical protein